MRRASVNLEGHRRKALDCTNESERISFGFALRVHVLTTLPSGFLVVFARWNRLPGDFWPRRLEGNFVYKHGVHGIELSKLIDGRGTVRLDGQLWKRTRLSQQAASRVRAGGLR